MLSQFFPGVTPWFCSALDKSHFLSQICKMRLHLKKLKPSCAPCWQSIKSSDSAMAPWWLQLQNSVTDPHPQRGIPCPPRALPLLLWGTLIPALCRARRHQLPQDGFAPSDSRELLYYPAFMIFLMKGEALEKDGKAFP